nr:hypothetical protein [Acidobacteriota bacterium]
ATFYARINVSAESAAAAAPSAVGPGDDDITKATPVVVQGARLWSQPDASRRYAPRSEREE